MKTDPNTRLDTVKDRLAMAGYVEAYAGLQKDLHLFRRLDNPRQQAVLQEAGDDFTVQFSRTGIKATPRQKLNHLFSVVSGKNHFSPVTLTAEEILERGPQELLPGGQAQALVLRSLACYFRGFAAPCWPQAGNARQKNPVRFLLDTHNTNDQYNILTAQVQPDLGDEASAVDRLTSWRRLTLAVPTQNNERRLQLLIRSEDEPNFGDRPPTGPEGMSIWTFIHLHTRDQEGDLLRRHRNGLKSPIPFMGQAPAF